MKAYLFLISGVLIIGGCIPDMKPPDRIEKNVTIGNVNIQWTSSSAAYANTADLVVAKKGDIADTLCRSTNIADIRSQDDQTLIIGFYGAPKLYNEDAFLRVMSFGFKIEIDSSFIWKSNNP